MHPPPRHPPTPLHPSDSMWPPCTALHLVASQHSFAQAPAQQLTVPEHHPAVLWAHGLPTLAVLTLCHLHVEEDAVMAGGEGGAARGGAEGGAAGSGDLSRHQDDDVISAYDMLYARSAISR
jgi:hypothetical protein